MMVVMPTVTVNIDGRLSVGQVLFTCMTHLIEDKYLRVWCGGFIYPQTKPLKRASKGEIAQSQYKVILVHWSERKVSFLGGASTCREERGWPQLGRERERNGQEWRGPEFDGSRGTSGSESSNAGGLVPFPALAGLRL